MKNGSDGSQRTGGFTVFLMAACVALAVLVVLLARQNMSLKNEISELAGTRIPETAFKEGDPLGAITLVSESGDSGPLGFGQGESRTLLFIFSMQCPACEMTLPVWEEIAGQIGEGSTLRVIGIQLDRPTDTESDPGALVAPAMPFEIFGLERPAKEFEGHLPYIPTTMILDREGHIEKVWYGMLEADQQDELRETIGARSS